MACRPMTLLMLSSPWEGSTAQPCEGPPASAEPTTPGARPARKEVSYGHASDHSGSAVQPSGGRCHRVGRDLPGASATSRTKNSRPYSCSLSRPPRSSHLAGEPAPATQPTGSEPSRGDTGQRAHPNGAGDASAVVGAVAVRVLLEVLLVVAVRFRTQLIPWSPASGRSVRILRRRHLDRMQMADETGH